MARLPQPGGDSGNWGEILNDFLLQSITPEGNLKEASIGTSQLKQHAVTADKLATNTAASGQVLSYDDGSLVWRSQSSDSTVSSDDITDASVLGKDILTATDSAAIRSAIGAGTSSLSLGTTSTTAKAGDYQPTADQVAETVTHKVLTATERTKLSGIASGATANSSDAQLRDRSTHTGTQLASTITGLAAIATTGNASDLSGVIGVDRITPGSVLAVRYNTTTLVWPSRPTSRSDVIVHWIGGTSSTPPSAALAGVDIWDRQV